MRNVGTSNRQRHNFSVPTWTIRPDESTGRVCFSFLPLTVEQYLKTLPEMPLIERKQTLQDSHGIILLQHKQDLKIMSGSRVDLITGFVIANA